MLYACTGQAAVPLFLHLVENSTDDQTPKLSSNQGQSIKSLAVEAQHTLTYSVDIKAPEPDSIFDQTKPLLVAHAKLTRVVDARTNQHRQVGRKGRDTADLLYMYWLLIYVFNGTSHW